jgi:hypothetical protein
MATITTSTRRLLTSFQLDTSKSTADLMLCVRNALAVEDIQVLRHFTVRPLQRVVLLALSECLPKRLGIAPGSAIVGRYVDDGQIEASYEGNLNGGLESIEQKYFQAASRLIERYPTVAHGIFPREYFDVIGTYALGEDYTNPRLYFFE